MLLHLHTDLMLTPGALSWRMMNYISWLVLENKTKIASSNRHLYKLLLLNLLPFYCLTAPDVYAVIRCEEDTVRTRVFKKNGNPEFNTKAIFYRRKPKRKICIEVRWILQHFAYKSQQCRNLQQCVCVFVCLQLWGRGLLFDSFLGRAYLQTGATERGRTRVIELQGGQSHGCIYVETSTSQCLTDLWLFLWLIQSNWAVAEIWKLTKKACLGPDFLLYSKFLLCCLVMSCTSLLLIGQEACCFSWVI